VLAIAKALTPVTETTFFQRPVELPMIDKPQYSVTLLPGNEVRFLSLSRTDNRNSQR
jgi:hypothetical protein